MPLDPQQQLHLIDARGNTLGDVSIARIEGNRVFASFTSAPSFATIAATFREFDDAVNDQLFHEVDRLQQEINGLGLRLAGDVGDDLLLDDVQINNGTDICFRVPNLGLTQTQTLTAEAG